MRPERWDRYAGWAVWFAWILLGAVTCILVVRALHGMRPEHNSVTGNFRAAARAWWAGENMYPSGVAGFLYFPQSAILYTPFTWGPTEVGEVSWRLACLALFATGLWRMSALVARGPAAPRDQAGTSGEPRARLERWWAWWCAAWRLPGAAFFIASAAAMPLVASNLRNGQFNLPLAALMLHAAADLRLERWWRAVLWLCLMTAIKPLGLAMALLAAVVYPRTAWRLAAGLIATALAPLAHPDPAYALAMYRASVHTLDTASQVELRHGQDLRGAFAALGVQPSPAALIGVRAAAAPLMLALAWLAKRRWAEPAGALHTLTAAGLYITLMNPRCEGLTYAALSPAIGLLFIARPPPVRGVAARATIFAIGLLTAISQVFTGGPNSWVRPAAAAVLLALVVWPLCRTSPENAGGPRPG